MLNRILSRVIQPEIEGDNLAIHLLSHIPLLSKPQLHLCDVLIEPILVSLLCQRFGIKDQIVRTDNDGNEI